SAPARRPAHPQRSARDASRERPRHRARHRAARSPERDGARDRGPRHGAARGGGAGAHGRREHGASVGRASAHAEPRGEENMRWVIIGVGSVVVIVFIILAVGAMLPAKHVARRTVLLHRAPEAVWAIITDFAAGPSWRPDLRGVELLPPREG